MNGFYWGAAEVQIRSSRRRCPAILSLCQAAVATCAIGFTCVGTAGEGSPPTVASSPDAEPQIDLQDLKRHAGFLASDTLEGRQAGTRGGQAAAAYLIHELKQLELEPAGSGGDYRQAFGAGYANILAKLPGRHPGLAREIILIGAHFDHVGYGNPTNSNGPYGRIHNGADDNASGVAVLLEIAEELATSAHPLSRSVLFCCWDAEEAGLLGSQHWVNHPTVDRQLVRLAINLDMVGRLRNDEVTVMGWRTAAGLRPLIAAQNSEARLSFRFNWGVTNDSDHYPFYAAQLPVLHFDTGKHDDYHRPSDDVERLNWEGMRRIGLVLAELIRSAASDSAPLSGFRGECWQERQPDWPAATPASPPVRFGITWNPERARQGIIETARVVDGYPAAEVGIMTGDQILRFHHWMEGTLDELRTEITTAPPEVDIAWLRKGESIPRHGRLRLRGEPEVCGFTYRSDPALPGCGVIDQVIETAPADRAGLRPGDVVVTIDGASAPPFTEFRNSLRSRNGTVRLRVERSGVMREAEVSLPLPPRESTVRTGSPRRDAGTGSE